ncbi:MAG: hypothetical protein QW379_00640 [Thermoplasmata archaeon]
MSSLGPRASGAIGLGWTRRPAGAPLTGAKAHVETFIATVTVHG